MPVILFTDFGPDLYVGQMKAVLLERAPDAPVIDLLHDAPAFDVQASAHMLAACVPRFPSGSVFLAVVDPGVGTERGTLVAECDGRWLVGPDNGLLSVGLARAVQARCWSIRWRPEGLSPSFHGRDLFAPVAADIAAGRWPEDRLVPIAGPEIASGAEDRWAVIYIDRYGNACTGVRAAGTKRDDVLAVAGRRLAYATTFGTARKGDAFWYENSLGLVEIAANQAHAAALLGLRIGSQVALA